MLADLTLPAGLQLARTTREFGAGDTPEGLRAAHRVASGVWGLLRVLEGRVDFVLEGAEGVEVERRHLAPGEVQVIEPGVLHHVEPAGAARFVIEFHR